MLFILILQKMFFILRQLDNHERRAIQTVLYESLLALTKLVSPILAHTADEVWKFIPAVKKKVYN